MIENALVAILNGEMKPVGTGFLIGREYVLTCAHVINSSLGKDKRSQDKPLAMVELAFVADKARTTAKAEVVKWFPPAAENGAVPEIEDLAALKLKVQPPENISIAQLAIYGELAGKKFEAFGFPSDYSKGQWQTGKINRGAQDQRWELLDAGEDKRPFVRGGFSGGPVIVNNTYVVGLVVSARAQDPVPSAYAIPIRDAAVICEALDIRILPGIALDFPHVSVLLRDEAASPTAKVFFDLRAKAVGDIEEIASLFLQQPPLDYGSGVLAPSAILSDGNLNAIFLQAPGGAGKSTFLRKLVLTAAEHNHVPFMLDVTKRLPGKLEELPEKQIIDSWALSGNFDHLKQALDQLGPERILLLVDRLNEGTLSPDQVLPALLRIAENVCPGVRLIAAGRVKRITAPEISRFTLCTVLPLPQQVQKKHLAELWNPGLSKLFANPFFVNMQLELAADKSKRKNLPRASMFRRFFQQHGSIREEEFSQLCEAAFGAYRDCKATVFPKQAWTKLLKAAGYEGDETVGGAVLFEKTGVESPENAQFQHQLLQDFLAGCYVAQDNARWCAEYFDDATLAGSSFEAIEFAAERLGTRAAEFLVQVYDWNYMAVIESVRNLDAGRHGASSPVSPDFKDALYFLNVLRLFDRFEHTRKRIETVLKDLKVTAGFELTEVSSVQDLKEKVSRFYQPVTEMFRTWKRLFLRNDIVKLHDLTLLAETPFLSWTAVNVFHALDWDASVESTVTLLYDTAKKISFTNIGYRWRAVHLLGGRSTNDIITFLFMVVADANENEWVRYGAVRSLAESISLVSKPDLRREYINRLARLIESKPGLPWIVLSEIINTAVLAINAPANWYEDYLLLLKKGREVSAAAGDERQVGVWEKRISKVSSLK